MTTNSLLESLNVFCLCNQRKNNATTAIRWFSGRNFIYNFIYLHRQHVSVYEYKYPA